VINDIFNDPPNRGGLYNSEGVQKLDAAKCMIAMESTSGRQRVFEKFVEDYISGRRFPDSFLQSLPACSDVLITMAT